MRRRTVAYGPAASQVAELWLPRGPERAPVAVLLHGGFWRLPYSKRLMVPLALALVRRGWAVWNVEYRRLGEGGGFPDTFADVATALDLVAMLDGVDATRVVTIGHSAGGTLALWLAARSRLSADAVAELGGPPAVLPVGAVSLAGVVDLAALADAGSGAVRKFLGDGPFSSTSPAALAPLGLAHLVVHSRDDSVVPLSTAQHYVEMAGEEAELVVTTGSHRRLLLPWGDGWRAVVRYLEWSDR